MDYLEQSLRIERIIETSTNLSSEIEYMLYSLEKLLADINNIEYQISCIPDSWKKITQN